MPGHKADVHPKRRSYARRMARGDTGRNYLNEFFDIIFYSVDNMLSVAFKDEERAPIQARKPLRGQENARPPSAKKPASSNSPTAAGQSLLEYIPSDADDAGGTSGHSRQEPAPRTITGNGAAQWGNYRQAPGGRPMRGRTRRDSGSPPPSSP